MRRLVPLALVAGVLALTGTASAACTTAGAGATQAGLCSRQARDTRQVYLTCAADVDADGTPDAACREIILLEY